MYLQFYKLQHPPFHTTPDPDFVYLSPSHKQALGSLIYGIQERKGFIALTGEVGLGKTTILRSFLSRFDDAHDRIIYLLNPRLSFKTLLTKLLHELGDHPVGSEELEFLSRLQDVLIEQYRKGRTVILLIDEAQNMPVATLENLRMLSNLETSKDKLIQIVLVGQPELDQLLRRHELRQVRQRMAVRATLVPLSKTESRAYIRYRLAKAGSKEKKIFTHRAVSVIIREAKGNPRRMNILCDNALVTGLGYRKNPVTAGIVKEVIADMNGAAHRFAWQRVLLTAGLGMVLMCIAGLIVLQGQGFRTGPSLVQLREFIAHGVEMMKKVRPSLEEGRASHAEVVVTEKQRILSNEARLSNEGSPDADSRINGAEAVSVVQEGDTLETLARYVYGAAEPEHIKQILDANPHIGNAHTLSPGQKVTFPRIAPAGVTTPSEPSSVPME